MMILAAIGFCVTLGVAILGVIRHERELTSMAKNYKARKV